VKLGKSGDTGEIDLFFRGDGNIKKEWANKNVNPDQLVSSYYVAWLRKLDTIRTYFVINNSAFTYQQVLMILAGN
jgi:hypothetical protein